MRQAEMVDDRSCRLCVGLSWSEDPAQVAELGDDLRLVDRQPAIDAVQPFKQDGGVFTEPLSAAARLPAALLLQRFREVPVVQSRHRSNVSLAKPVDQTLVEVQTGEVEFSSAIWEDPGPGNGEPIRLDTEVREQVDIVAPAVEVVAGDRTRTAIGDPARLVAEHIPNGTASATSIDRTLDLVRRGGQPESERRVEGGRGDAGRRSRARRRRTRRGGRRTSGRACPKGHPGRSQQCGAEHLTSGRPTHREHHRIVSPSRAPSHGDERPWRQSDRPQWVEESIEAWRDQDPAVGTGAGKVRH